MNRFNQVRAILDYCEEDQDRAFAVIRIALRRHGKLQVGFQEMVNEMEEVKRRREAGENPVQIQQGMDGWEFKR